MELNTSILFNLITSLFQKLLSLVALEDENGNKFEIKEIRAPKNFFLRQPQESNQSLEYQPLRPYILADPRIDMIKNLLEIALSYVHLINTRDFIIHSYGFRWRDLKNWLVSTSTGGILKSISWKCHVNCEFCCQKGIPPEICDKKYPSPAELKTRLKYYDFQKNLGLIEGVYYRSEEMLTHPYIFRIFRALRKKDRNTVFGVCTNGVVLSQKMVKALAKLKPLKIDLSLNSANPDIRREIMRDPYPEGAINSVPLLNKYKIPFHITIVPWPGLPLEDIENTIKYAEKYNASFVKIHFPGYTKFFCRFSRKELFDLNKFWLNIIEYLRRIRKNFSIPVIYYAEMFAENVLFDELDRAYIAGVIRGSPAHETGITYDDIIVKINKKRIVSREMARDLLSRHKKVRLKLERNNKFLEISLRDPQKDWDRFGILMPAGIVHEDVDDIRKYAILHKAKNILLLSSKIVRPTIDYLLEKYNIAKKCKAKIYVDVPKNRFFGGNIILGDLLVVDDFIKAIHFWQKRNKKKPDLIIIPYSPFMHWGRDLTGKSILEIERTAGVPVEFIYNKPIF